MTAKQSRKIGVVVPSRDAIVHAIRHTIPSLLTIEGVQISGVAGLSADNDCPDAANEWIQRFQRSGELMKARQLGYDISDPAASRFACQRGYESAAAMLAGQRLDGVIIVGPGALRVETAVRAMESCCDVLLEEARVIEPAAWDAMAQVAIDHRRVLAAAHPRCHQLAPAHRMVAAGEFGRVTSAAFVVRKDGIPDAPHLLEEAVAAVLPFFDDTEPSHVEANATQLRMSFRDDRKADIHVSWKDTLTGDAEAELILWDESGVRLNAPLIAQEGAPGYRPDPGAARVLLRRGHGGPGAAWIGAPTLSYPEGVTAGHLDWIRTCQGEGKLLALPDRQLVLPGQVVLAAVASAAEEPGPDGWGPSMPVSAS